MTVVVHYRRHFEDFEEEFETEAEAWEFIEQGEDYGELYAGHIVDGETRAVLWQGDDPFRMPERWFQPTDGRKLDKRATVTP